MLMWWVTKRFEGQLSSGKAYSGIPGGCSRRPGFRFCSRRWLARHAKISFELSRIQKFRQPPANAAPCTGHHAVVGAGVDRLCALLSGFGSLYEMLMHPGDTALTNRRSACELAAGGRCIVRCSPSSCTAASVLYRLAVVGWFEGEIESDARDVSAVQWAITIFSLDARTETHPGGIHEARPRAPRSLGERYVPTHVSAPGKN